MVDKARVESPPDLVWLSSNCCDLTPAAQQQKPAPVPDNKVREQAPLRPRLLELLKRARRAW
jgi:hypothetical protein